MNILFVAATSQEITSKKINTQPNLITGLGMVNTAMYLTKELINNNFDLVINMGIAGAFSSTFKKGDEQVTEKSLPAVDYLKIPDDGEPYLEGHKCENCGAVFLGERSVCSKCFARDKMSVVKLQETGVLHSFSVVYRSFPGIDVPYVSAIVDLDGGGTVKGNLINIEPDPEKINFGMKVKLTYQDALGRKDKDGNSYLSYFFEPA